MSATTRPFEVLHNESFARIEAANADVRAGPHGWIQWKGTRVCMDVWCTCGKLTHVDAEFLYHVQCGACGKMWHVSGEVRLVEATEEEALDIVDNDRGYQVSV